MRSALHHLAKRGTAGTWYCVKAIPKELQAALGSRHHLLKSLGTTDRAVALAKRSIALAELEAEIEKARRPARTADVMEAARTLNATYRGIQEGDSFGAYVWQDGVDQSTAELAERYGPAVANGFRGVAYGIATPLQASVESWLAEPGNKGPLTERTKAQRRSVLNHLEAWLASNGHPTTVEGVSKAVAGSYVTTTMIKPGMHPNTANARLSALASYWKWLGKRAGVTVNPWAGQSFHKPSRRMGGENKREYTDSEMLALLTGPADPLMADVIRIAALTGMRRSELFALQVRDCANGIFDITASKSEAGVRAFPIHSALLPIIERRAAGKMPTDYLIDRGKAKHPGDAFGKRFARYRQSVGAHDRTDGKRHSRVDFHSFRRWLITRARNAGFDYATVTAIVGHENGNTTDDVYSGGPDIAMKRKCMEAVRLPAPAEEPQSAPRAGA